MKTKAVVDASMKKIRFCSMLIGIAMLSNTAFAASPIHGTYVVTAQKTCVNSSWRTTATPAYFHYNTADNTPYGYVQVPTGTTYADAANNTWRMTQTDKYVMTLNPLNNTITISDGNYSDLPDIVINSNPPIVADFGTFTGTGSFTYTAPNSYIDVSMQTLALVGDGVSQVENTDSGTVRLETQNKGADFYAAAGRGVITLQHNLTANLYRDRVCTSTTEGHRISKDY